jgi:hypothetical protein
MRAVYVHKHQELLRRAVSVGSNRISRYIPTMPLLAVVGNVHDFGEWLG